MIFKNKLQFAFMTTCLVLFIWCYNALILPDVLTLPQCGINLNTSKNAHLNVCYNMFTWFFTSTRWF